MDWGEGGEDKIGRALVNAKCCLIKSVNRKRFVQMCFPMGCNRKALVAKTAHLHKAQLRLEGCLLAAFGAAGRSQRSGVIRKLLRKKPVSEAAARAHTLACSIV